MFRPPKSDPYGIFGWTVGWGQWYARRSFEMLRCELHERTLVVKRGILFRVEKTIPLDKIQDLVDEGTPKRLRSVRLSGNTDTRSRVVLRKVFQMPGETLDMTKVDRSLGSLDALRYFQDPASYGGVRFELLPVEQPLLVQCKVPLAGEATLT